jgi:hypothetical protein
MNKRISIVIGNKQLESDFESTNVNREFFYTLFDNEAYLYHIKHTEVDSYIIFTQNLLQINVEKVVENIVYLNPMVSILIIHQESWSTNNLRNYNNLFVLTQVEELTSHLNEIQQNHRKYNRVEWPVKTKMFNNRNPEKQYKGNILSLSAGGCFIPINGDFLVNDSLEMTISFKDFDFYCIGFIVRTVPAGIAIEFREITPQTKDCIKRIINDRILGNLMKKIDPEQGEGIENIGA